MVRRTRGGAEGWWFKLSCSWRCHSWHTLTGRPSRRGDTDPPDGGRDTSSELLLLLPGCILPYPLLRWASFLIIHSLIFTTSACFHLMLLILGSPGFRLVSLSLMAASSLVFTYLQDASWFSVTHWTKAPNFHSSSVWEGDVQKSVASKALTTVMAPIIDFKVANFFPGPKSRPKSVLNYWSLWLFLHIQVQRTGI